ncbi:hypothetical protein [Actinoallomurus rhizosphaericola]|uniref:hypothetical protein n=1 Tax=Actinoallomurus rhizosphaericola TaxID=2952536 RepID=UPI002093904C|nr:hypothetical protein [Actinoallomurus rhizosphaericola]MCO5998803.1 hypothetical protein [Actinoallomurus rhizosphaericola]
MNVAIEAGSVRSEAPYTPRYDWQGISDEAELDAIRARIHGMALKWQDFGAASPFDSPDMGVSWPDEGGAARRPVGSMDTGHTVHSRRASREVRGHARGHRRIGDP